MSLIFYICGKSASGKDSLYDKLKEDPELDLEPIVPCTTRPMRSGEQEGVDYHFMDEERFQKLLAAGKIIEHREYNTVYGIWHYFTVDDEAAATARDRIAVGTLESLLKLTEYYGKDRVVPLYIEVEDGLRLARALKREMKPGNHCYEEMCRRFLADQKDFSEKKLAEAGITRRFSNNGSFDECLSEVRDEILARKAAKQQ